MKRFLSLLSLLPVCLTASAATISFSSITSTNAVKGADQLLVNSALGGTNYATRTATVGTLQTAVVTGSSVTNALGYKPQPASANLTNWSAIAATSAGIQSTLGQVYQATNSNLTLLSGYGPATWQATNANLTLLQAYGPGTWQATNANLTLLQAYGPGTWQATNANLTTLATLNGGSLTNIAASNIVSGGQLVMGSVSSDSATVGGLYYVKSGGASRGITTGVTVSGNTNLSVTGTLSATATGLTNTLVGPNYIYGDGAKTNSLVVDASGVTVTGGTTNLLYGPNYIYGSSAATNGITVDTSGVTLTGVPKIYFGTNVLSYTGTNLTWNGGTVTVTY